MTETERAEWKLKRARLPAEHAEQWTEDVYDHYLRLQKAKDAWKKANNRPSDVLGCVKDDGMLTPLFVPNETYLWYQEVQQFWIRNHEPRYIRENQARMSSGDFGEEDDWAKVE